MSIFIKKNHLISKNLNNIERMVSKQRNNKIISFSVVLFLTQTNAATIYHDTLSEKEITLNDGDSIYIDNNSKGNMGISYSSNLYNNGIINLGKNVSINVTKDSNSPMSAIQLGSKNSQLTANNLNIDINNNSTKTNNYIYGIRVLGNNNNLDLGNNSTINVSSTANKKTLIGLAIGTSTFKANALTVNLTNPNYALNNTGITMYNHGSIVDLGDNSHIKLRGGGLGISVFGSGGMESSGQSKFTANKLTVDVKGYLGRGMEVQIDSIADLGSDSFISVDGGTKTSNGSEALGIFEGSIFNAKRFTIEGLNETLGVVMSRVYDLSFDSIVNIGEGSVISTEQGSAVLNRFVNGTFNYIGTADSRNKIQSGGVFAVTAERKAALSHLKYTDTYINNQYNKHTTGYYANNSGIIKAEDSSLFGTEGTTGAEASNGGLIQLTGDTTIHMADASETALQTSWKTGYKSATIIADGKLSINGSVKSNGGTIDLTMKSGSSWYGSAETDNLNDGYLNATLTDSRWTVLSNSSLDNLTVNHSLVQLSDNKTNSGYNTLQVTNLSGNGNFLFHTDIANRLSDKLVVTATSSGSHSVSIQNRGDLNTTGNEVLPVIFTHDGTASFKARQKTELGGYLYDLRKTGNNWELYATLRKKKPAEVTSTANAGGNFLNIGYLLNFAETQTMMQKLNKIRQSPQHNNFWIRGTGGHFNSFSSGKLRSFDMSYKGMQMGADKKLDSSLPLYIGAMIGYTQGSPNYKQGSGTVKSSNAGIYLILQHANGFYIDGLLRISSLRNQFSVLDSQDKSIAGHGSSSGFGLSLESGQKFHLNQKGNGLYLEPQVQFSYLHQNDANLRANNGLTIGLNNYDSMLGRTSAILGYQSTNARSVVTVYLKTGIVHEFAGNSVFTLNSSPESHQFKGTWWSNGVGLNANVANNHLLYVEADTTNGNQFNQRQITGCYRYNF